MLTALASTYRRLMPPRLPPLADRLEQHDAGRDRHVQAADLPAHGHGAATKSQCSRTSRRSPSPSAPTTSAVGRRKSIRRRRLRSVGVEADGPDAQRLQLLDGARDVDHVDDPDVRERAGRRLRRRAPSGAAWRACRTTPCAPAASAVRRIAPTLCGSSMPSSTTISGRARAADDLLPASSVAARRQASASTPWCRSPRGQPVQLGDVDAPRPAPPSRSARRHDFADARVRTRVPTLHLADAAAPAALRAPDACRQ